MESLVHYCNPSHGISLLSALNEQRLKGQLCDVVLLVGDQQYQAHKSVLTSCSEYFQSVFSRRDGETQSIIQLDFCESDAFEIVLNYIYSSSLFVEKCSLAAIQELGYSLGIPFLTNIMSARPQASYCVSRKRTSLSEEEDGAYQKKSVIVHKGQSDQPAVDVSRRSLSFQEKPRKQTASMIAEKLAREFGDQSYSSGHARRNEKENSTSVSTTSNTSTGDCRSIISSPTSILRRRTEYRPPSIRPQLTSSVSFSESVQHTSLQSDQTEDSAEERVETSRDSRPAGEHPRNQTVDRSGPLIKSLLRRSLSMDSPVPVFSPALELKDSQSREQSVVKLTSPTGRSASPENEGRVSKDMPLILRSRERSMYETEATQTTQFRIKAEPSSPLPDPSEIVRITVGDNLPVNFKDFQAKYDEGPRGYFTPSMKRKSKLDGSYLPFKRTRSVSEHHLSHQDSTFDEVPYNSNADGHNEEPGELRPNKMFKCWNCLKVFRSNAGLYRHVNMYHNPEKPYACDICHKRFHTNFKVWTHCQTQHGVVQNPAPSSSSYSVLDEKFQRKLIDIVREREIKKALIMKLRRSKQGLQSQTFGRKSRRSRSYGCPYCGKMFFFQSHLKLHMKGHAAEPGDLDNDPDGDLQYKQQQLTHLKENQERDVFSCRLCNEKLPSLAELEDHERACRYATVCPYCGLRFSNTAVKKDHEAHCKYKKLTCLECMRTFKSSFSIWRHQVEVHNHNMMTVKEQLTLGLQESNHGEESDTLGVPPSQDSMHDNKEDAVYSDSSVPPMFDSEDSSSYVPEDLSSGHGELRVKEEPQEEPVSAKDNASASSEEPGVWPCEKCGKLFSAHKDLERHQELLCHIKPFICHICHKAFRTNFRLWSHYQSHMSTSDGMREIDFSRDRVPSSPSPSPPLTIALPDPPSSQEPQLGARQSEEEASSAKPKKPEQVDKTGEDEPGEHSLAKSSSTDKVITPQESDTLFYHAPTLSALTFKRQYMCKFCHRTFKTAFSLWSHEQSHT